MNEIFQKLPKDITNIILQYDGRIVCRNGRYMNIIVNPDAAFPLLYERMKFNKYRRIIGGCFGVRIQVIQTDQILQNLGVIQKEFYYSGTKNGLSIYVVLSKDNDYNWHHYKLYANYTATST